MLFPFWKFFVTSAVLILACGGAAAELMEDATAPVIPNLHTLSRGSGYIFSGTVMKVERIASTRKDAVAVMRITFQVDNAIRGVSHGQRLVIREWAGLWQSGERYRSGERVMLFLYPPSKLGLTSPVGGPMGRFRINTAGRIVVPRGPTRPRSPRLPDKNPSGRTRVVSLRELARALRREPGEQP
ncbi:MAG: hypothetical protein WB952_12390 [Terriglobales bacterium]